jgi:hypothetical protein
MKLQTKKVSDLRSVRKFFEELVENNVIFHCDESFHDYVNFETNENTFSFKQAEKLDELMNECFSICESKNKDIYELAMSVLLENIDN